VVGRLERCEAMLEALYNVLVKESTSGKTIAFCLGLRAPSAPQHHMTCRSP
jgi:hypothetical protein